MSNDTAKTITTNIVPVQGIFEPAPTFSLVSLIGPAGTPFYANINPAQSGLNITNSTINSTVIGGVSPSTATFTQVTLPNPPSSATDAVNKVYLDNFVAGISWKEPVLCATTANITLSGTQTIDNVAVVAGDRVLVKNQSTAADNGIYVVSAGSWTRAVGADDYAEYEGAVVFVISGSGNAGTTWYSSAQPGGTLGVTAINWFELSISLTYTAGTGLTLVGTQFNIANTGVSAATYGAANTIPVIAVNAQGQITSATNTSIAINGNQITSGTIGSAYLSGSYTGITGVGTLTNLTVTNTISGSINGNAATATTAGSATTATTATNIAGGASGSIPYQTASGTTALLPKGTDGQILALASGLPAWIDNQTGTVTSVSGTGTVSGITLSGTVTSSGSLTLGGSLDLSSPPAIGGTAANTVRGTTVTATTGFVGTNYDAANSGGGALRNASGVSQLQWGAGGGSNITFDVATNINPANAAVAISPTGTGTVAISPAGALTINPTTASTMNNVAIGGTTPLAGTFTTLRVNSTISLAGSTGTSGHVLTSNGASAPTWQALPASGITITDDTTTNAIRYLTFTSATSGSITGENVASTKLTFNPSTGNFGIGTSSPSAMLTIGRSDSSNEGGQIDLCRASDNASAWAIDVYGNTSTPSLRFIDNVAASARMAIDSSGNVGIGTSSPSSDAIVKFINISDATSSGIVLTAPRKYSIYSSSSSQLAFRDETAAANRMIIDSLGTVGVGVTPNSGWSATLSKAIQIADRGASISSFTSSNTSGLFLHLTTNAYYSDTGWRYIATNGNLIAQYEQVNGEHVWKNAVSGSAGNAVSFTERMRLTDTGNLQFNSGYGSVATAYGCRAWVNFNGTGTVAIRAQGNVSSITDNGTGDYTVNFTTSMPDANYCVHLTADYAQQMVKSAATFGGSGTNPTASAVRVFTRDGGSSASDAAYVYVAITR